MHIHTRVCTCVCICLNPELFVPFTSYPSCGFQNCFSASASFLRFVSISSCLTCALPSLQCLLPLSSLHSSLDFCLHFPSSFPIACSFYIPSSPLPFFSSLLPLVYLPLSAQPSLPSSPPSPLYLLVLVSQNIPSLHLFVFPRL